MNAVPEAEIPDRSGSTSNQDNGSITPPKILGICIVKNEQDVIEAMVRHNLRFLDRLVVIDIGSVDATRKILHQLSQELSQLTVNENNRFAWQTKGLTPYLHHYQYAYPSEFVMGLDADEFLDLDDKVSLRAALAGIPQGGYGLLPWRTYVLRPQQRDIPGADPLRQMEWRRREELPPYYKAIIRLGGAPADHLEISPGNHLVRILSGQSVPVVQLHWLRLLHYPVRSRDQLVAKNIVGWMAWLPLDKDAGETTDNREWRENCDCFLHNTTIDQQALCELSLLYLQAPRTVDWQGDVVQEPSRLVYQLHYSTGQCLGALELITRSWERSLTGTETYSPSLEIASVTACRTTGSSLSGQTRSPMAETPTPTVSQGKEKAAEAGACQQGAPFKPFFGLSGVVPSLVSGSHLDAIRLVEAAVVESESAKLWNDLAALRYASGQTSLAEQGFRRALVLDPSHRQAAVNLSLLLLAEGLADEVPALLDPHRTTLTEQEKQSIRDLVHAFLPAAGKVATQNSEASRAHEAHGSTASSYAVDTQSSLHPNPRKKFLVVVRAGKGSLHPLWLKGSARRNWDLLVHSFAPECPWINEEGVEIVRAEGPEIPGPKMRAIHLLYQKRRPQFQAYDYIFLADDDLAADLETMNGIFLLCEHYGLEYAQPAITADSYASNWPITMENSSFILRYTNVAENMAPVFSRSFFERCALTFCENVSGYGIELIWSSWVSSYKKLAILDACPVRHTRPNRSGALYQQLDQKGIDPDQEHRDLIRKWRLLKEQDPHPVYPTARVWGGILLDQTCLTLQEGNGIELMRALMNGFPEQLKQDPRAIAAMLQPMLDQLLVSRFSGSSSHGPT